jgi:tmRNA-binding protein
MFLKKIIAGVKLNSKEVSYFKVNRLSSKGSYVKIVGGYALLKTNLFSRKYFILLLKKKEIFYLKSTLKSKGFIVNPSSFISKNGLIKLCIDIKNNREGK